MTAAEVIEKLREYPPDMQVFSTRIVNWGERDFYVDYGPVSRVWASEVILNDDEGHLHPVNGIKVTA